uniref:dolichyl-phosphate-mannose--protein mannosyltransferase n=1 Tax=Cyprinus carpio TaxID=7962 RepID=A0A8C1Y5S4_CYPCA
MVLSEPYWDHHIPLPKLGPLHSRLVTAFVALICFINSYNGDFVFDDSEAIINNKDLNPDTPLSNIWKNDFWGSNLSSNSSHKSYRPLTVLTFRINYLLAGGLHPIGFHMLNVALHCVISVLMIDVFAILIGGLVHDGRGVKLNLSPKASFLAALFFAAHPVHTESVAGIVGRADLLCALFFQLSFLVYCKAFQGGDKKFSVLWIFSSILLCAVAMLCKEQGITVLIGGLVSSGLLMRLVLLFLGGSFLLYARWRIMGTGPPSFTEVDNPASFAENVILRIVNYNYYYSLNAWLLLCPWWLCFDWSMGCVPLIKSATDWRIVWPLLLWCCLMGLVYQALCSQDSNKRSLLINTLNALSKTLNISSLTFSFLAQVHYNVGKNLADRGNQSAAVKYYREAVRLHPKYVHAMNNLGNILKERNELEEAEELLSSAVHIQPDFAAAWMNLGIVQNSLKKFDKAEQSYWNAIKFRKKYPDCYYNLGRLYADLNRSIDALNAWRNATMLKPDHSLAWNNMVILLDNTGNLAQAELIGKEALKILPKDHTIMFSLANVLGKQEKYKESEGFFLNALKINPNVASCHGNLAVLYHRWGKLDLAKRHYELSLRLDPNAPGTKENYNMLKRKLEQRQRTVG